MLTVYNVRNVQGLLKKPGKSLLQFVSLKFKVTFQCPKCTILYLHFYDNKYFS